jgi:membrane peptidoglycan carboxypeptidase
MGIEGWQENSSRFGLSLTLGGGEVKMTDLTEAFGAFANGGKHIDVIGVQEIENLHGDKIDFDKPVATQVLDSGVSYIISDILSDNAARQLAFGPGSALEIPGYKASVKTGTTNELKDNWTIGYTPEYVVSVWVGNNDNTSMNPYLVSGITGAAPIWNRMMKYLLEKEYPGKPNTWMEKPADIVERNCSGRTEYFISGTENSAFCAQPVNNFQNGNRWQNFNFNNQRPVR